MKEEPKQVRISKNINYTFNSTKLHIIYYTHSTLIQKDEPKLPKPAKNHQENKDPTPLAVVESEDSSAKSSIVPSSSSSSCSEKEHEASEVASEVPIAKYQHFCWIYFFLNPITFSHNNFL